MLHFLRGHQDSTVELEERVSILPPEEPKDMEDEKVTEDYNSEASEPSIEPDAKEEK